MVASGPERQGIDVRLAIRPTRADDAGWNGVSSSAAGEDIEFSFKSRQRVHDDVLAGVGWAIAGGGLFQIYHFVAREAVKAGQLIEVI